MPPFLYKHFARAVALSFWSLVTKAAVFVDGVFDKPGEVFERGGENRRAMKNAQVVTSLLSSARALMQAFPLAFLIFLSRGWV